MAASSDITVCRSFLRYLTVCSSSSHLLHASCLFLEATNGWVLIIILMKIDGHLASLAGWTRLICTYVLDPALARNICRIIMKTIFLMCPKRQLMIMPTRVLLTHLFFWPLKVSKKSILKNIYIYFGKLLRAYAFKGLMKNCRITITICIVRMCMSWKW